MNTDEKDTMIKNLEADNKRLRQWVNDLQSGMYVNCVYCGHRYGPSENTPVSMADVLKEHIEHCPEHPMSKLKAQLAASQRMERAAVEDLSTYKDCGFCIHLQDQQYCYKNCQRHVDVDNFRTHPCWQWRGPQAEEGAEK